MPLQLPTTPLERLIVALDVSTESEALTLAERLGPNVLWVKVGLELFCTGGPPIVRALAGMGKRIFLDLKFHDIPNTVAGAVKTASKLPVQLLNLHASAGVKAMEAAQAAAAERSDLGIIAVTRLTSDESAPSGFADVERFAEQAARAGLFGVVCPAGAAPILRSRYGDSLVRVCPGIRPAGGEIHDQVHVSTPEGAFAAGAHWIVVGRPITRAADPGLAARGILEALTRGVPGI
jgi:orotidine-5'-phosphate decarboxylase